MITITISIVLLTAVISFTAFSNEKVMDDLIFYPPSITNRNQWYRFITCGFIHADIMHLVFNMYSFYLFGDIVEKSFGFIFGESGKMLYVLLYLSALIVSILPTYFNHQNDYRYRSLGASGAVSAIIFVGIFLYPTLGMGIFPIPFHIPGFVFGSLRQEDRFGGRHAEHVFDRFGFGLDHGGFDLGDIAQRADRGGGHGVFRLGAAIDASGFFDCAVCVGHTLFASSLWVDE
jgi:hypothetical protein